MAFDDGVIRSFEETAVSELFHENSKQQRSDQRIAERIIAMAANPAMHNVVTARKKYPLAKKIPLPTDYPDAKTGFDEAVLSRRSLRNFQGTPIQLREAAKLLHFAYGVTGSAMAMDGKTQFFRAAPSGGALYPLEIYLWANHIEGLPQGIYKYDPIDNVLAELSVGNQEKEFKALTYTDEIKNAAAVFALTGISLKTRLKYGERGYRFMLLEAGHIAQNILLTANALKLIALPIGGFVDDELDDLLGIDGLDEVSLYLVAVGQGNRQG